MHNSTFQLKKEPPRSMTLLPALFFRGSLSHSRLLGKHAPKHSTAQSYARLLGCKSLSEQDRSLRSITLAERAFLTWLIPWLTSEANAREEIRSDQPASDGRKEGNLAKFLATPPSYLECESARRCKAAAFMAFQFGFACRIGDIRSSACY